MAITYKNRILKAIIRCRIHQFSFTFFVNSGSHNDFVKQVQCSKNLDCVPAQPGGLRCISLRLEMNSNASLP